MPTHSQTRRVADTSAKERVLPHEPVTPTAGSLMRIEEFCRATQMSLRQFFVLVKRGEAPALTHIGTRGRRISQASYEAWVAKQTKEAS
jgi:predicted DNA-binding transcriptional regulator AlpA